MAKFESLTFESEIHKRMTEIAQVKPTLLVGFGGFSESNEITAKVVDLNEEKKVVGISSLRNKAGKNVEPNNNLFHVVTSVNGLTYRFSSKLRHANFCNGFYEFDFPKVFEYLQRRAYYRVPLKSGDADVSLDVGSVTPVMAELQDISVAGMRVKTRALDQMSLGIGDAISRCRLNIYGFDNIRFSATVRYKERLQNDEYVMGFSIKDIDNTHQNIIERFVAIRDMELRKQRVGWR